MPWPCHPLLGVMLGVGAWAELAGEGWAVPVGADEDEDEDAELGWRVVVGAWDCSASGSCAGASKVGQEACGASEGGRGVCRWACLTCLGLRLSMMLCGMEAASSSFKG